MNTKTMKRWLPLIAVAFLALNTLAVELKLTKVANVTTNIAATVPIEQQSPISRGEVTEVVAKVSAAVTALIGLGLKLRAIAQAVLPPSAGNAGANASLILLTLLPSIVSAQAPAKRAFSVTFETGIASTWTTSQKDERAAVIVSANLPIRSGGLGARIDIGGSRGQSAVDLSNPSTFRSAEMLLGVYHRILPATYAICFGGVGYSIEGSDGAPADGRMYTGACGVRGHLGRHSLTAAYGRRGSIGGRGFLGSATVAKGDKANLRIDAALGSRSRWEMRSTVTVVPWSHGRRN